MRELLNEEPSVPGSRFGPPAARQLVFRLLPLRLLELRALRLHGRGSAEWHEAIEQPTGWLRATPLSHGRAASEPAIPVTGEATDGTPVENRAGAWLQAAARN